MRRILMFNHVTAEGYFAGVDATQYPSGNLVLRYELEDGRETILPKFR